IGPVPGCKSMKNSTSLIGGKLGISDGKRLGTVEPRALLPCEHLRYLATPGSGKKG
ncbi:hypothetical protein A2U01_0073756, partial [Trifolium medium]|nr:hypothetical protein [Trifolium medium]